MRSSGYVENVIVEVCAALGILAKYGILGVGVNAANSNANAPTVNCINLSSLQDQANANATAGNNVLGALSQINIDSYIGTVSPTPGTSIDGLDLFRHTTAAAAAAVQSNQTQMALNNNNLTLPTNTTMQTVGNFSKTTLPLEISSKEKNVEIPEVIVGAILGKFLNALFVAHSCIQENTMKIITFTPTWDF